MPAIDNGGLPLSKRAADCVLSSLTELPNAQALCRSKHCYRGTSRMEIVIGLGWIGVV
jgi:hypothetical protein